MTEAELQEIETWLPVATPDARRTAVQLIAEVRRLKALVPTQGLTLMKTGELELAIAGARREEIDRCAAEVDRVYGRGVRTYVSDAIRALEPKQ